VNSTIYAKEEIRKTKSFWRMHGHGQQIEVFLLFVFCNKAGTLVVLMYKS
jgi:hypothetical protein